MAEDAQKSGIRPIRVLFVCLTVLLILALGGHTVWNLAARNHLRARITALQKAGEPIFPADFDVKDAEGPDNAAADIVAAAAMIDGEDAAWTAAGKLDPALPLQADERQILGKLVDQSGGIFARLEAARTKPRAVLNPRLRTPVLDHMRIRNFDPLRGLMSLLGDAALVDHDRGDDASAMHRLDLLLLVARYADTDPSLLGHLIALGASERTADRISQIAPTLRIGSSPQEAAPQDVRRLIESLLDDRSVTDGLRLGLRGERMLQLDMFQCMGDGTPVKTMPGQPAAPQIGRGRVVIKPLINANAASALDYMAALMPLVDEKTWPAVQSKMPVLSRRTSIVNALSNGIVALFDRPFEMHFRTVTDRHLAATLLALKWYAAEHDGKLPQKLDELVPKYLPAVPVDPMAAGSQPIRYLPNAASPFIYSVGLNGKDDGGESSIDERTSENKLWRMQDHVTHLTPQPRPPREDQDLAASPEAPTTATQPTSAP